MLSGHRVQRASPNGAQSLCPRKVQGRAANGPSLPYSTAPLLLAPEGSLKRAQSLASSPAIYTPPFLILKAVDGIAPVPLPAPLANLNTMLVDPAASGFSSKSLITVHPAPATCLLCTKHQLKHLAYIISRT